MNIDLGNWTYARLRDVFDIARCNKSKEYPKDTILVQVSATRGQVIYLDKAQRVEDGSKYATLTVKEPDKYNAKYLYYVLDLNMPDIVERCKSGINLQMDALSGEKIQIHRDMNTQNTIVTMLDVVVKCTEIEARTVELLRQHKEEMLDKMLC
jgi:hypothetical protein